jgi:hypothetical protein
VKADANGSAPTGAAGSAATGSSGRGLLGLGRKKPEAEPEPIVSEVKVARQQPVRQPRSKRSGNAGNSGKR